MVNFRYHVVSLVAVFIALAVGIVLGAGPLKEPISSSLADQVDSLRADKDALRAELEAAEALGESADAAFAELQPVALAGLLTGRRVALVAAGTDLEDRLEALRAGLAMAGASLAAEVRLEPGLLDGPDGPRAELAQELAALAGGGAQATLADSQQIALALATALKGLDDAVSPASGPGGAGGEGAGGGAGGGAGTGGPQGGAGGEGAGGEAAGSGAAQTGGASGRGEASDGGQDSAGGSGDGGAAGAGSGAGSGAGQDGAGQDGAGQTDQADPAALWQALTESGLVSGSLESPAEAVVVLTGPWLADGADPSPQQSAPPGGQAGLDLVAALAQAGLPLVASGPDQVAADLPRRIAEDAELSQAVSTVAAPVKGAEVIAALWAAAAELGGLHGAYALSGGEAVWPPHAPAPLEPPDPAEPAEPEANGASDAPTPPPAEATP
ncbi:MAG: copper transporter [Bifidobacteriaceae bacterium]|jgi:hypothetical protein|nr:copper transporter [Bifidobacteriaceae bacterium]